MSLRSGLAVFGAVVVLAPFSSITSAQTTGTILGQVKDATGAVVSNAAVKAKNLNTTQTREAVTNTEGSYLIPALPPGAYEVSVEISGFKTFVQSGITLRVGENARLDIGLELGTINEKISVTAEALKVDTQSTIVGTTVDNRRLKTIPLNGRNIYSLTQLIPGVGAPANILASEPNARVGVTMSVSGNREDQNNILLDGTGMVTPFLNVGVNLPNPDAIQEFRVFTSTFSAEFGRASGAVFLAVTKSGSNEIHGILYEFLRNNKLNASNFFTPGQVPKLVQNQFGGSIGGPVIKNRTFLFAALQGIRIRQESITTYFPPTASERQGDFSASGKTIRDPNNNNLPFPGNVIPLTRFDPLTVNFMKEYIELPNGPGGRYQTLYAVPTNGTEITIKGDHNLRAADRLAIRYYGKRDEANNQGSQVLKLAGATATAIKTGVLNETHIFNPGLLAEFRVSYLRTYPNWTQSPLAKSPRDLGGNYNYDGPTPNAPNFTIAGRVSASPQRTFQEPDRTWEVAGKLSWIHGRHAIKFGTEIRALRHLTRVQEWGGSATFDGGFTGDAVADYMIGRTSSLGLRPFGQDESFARQYQFFVQDDFRVSRHLTLNVGVRYEYFRPWVEGNDEVSIVRFGQQSTIFPTAPPGLVFPGDRGVPRGLYSADKNNFAPRFGIAWDPFGNGRTSIRMAYGIFTTLTAAAVSSQINQGLPFGIKDTMDWSLTSLSPLRTRTFPAVVRGAGATSQRNP